MKNLVNKNGIASKKQNLADETKFKDNISFSFEFFRQCEWFGLGECDKEWYALLVNELTTVSAMTVTDLYNNRKKQQYHPINWSQKNIPVQPDDIDWIPEEYRQHLWQFHITKSRGRVVGFLYNNIFFIVLLDPKHNIQPCKKHNYKLTETTISQNSLEKTYDNLLHDYQEIVDLFAAKKYSEIEIAISTHKNEYRHIIYATLDTEEDYQWYINSTDGMSLTEVVNEYLILKDCQNDNEEQ